MSAELGKTYRDRASGFTGVATGRAVYLGEAPSVRITGKAGTAVAIVSEWIAEGRLEELPEPSIGFSVPAPEVGS